MLPPGRASKPLPQDAVELDRTSHSKSFRWQEGGKERRRVVSSLLAMHYKDEGQFKDYRPGWVKRGTVYHAEGVGYRCEVTGLGAYSFVGQNGVRADVALAFPSPSTAAVVEVDGFDLWWRGVKKDLDFCLRLRNTAVMARKVLLSTAAPMEFRGTVTVDDVSGLTLNQLMYGRDNINRSTAEGRQQHAMQYEAVVKYEETITLLPGGVGPTAIPRKRIQTHSVWQQDAAGNPLVRRISPRTHLVAPSTAVVWPVEIRV